MSHPVQTGPQQLLFIPQNQFLENSSSQHPSHQSNNYIPQFNTQIMHPGTSATPLGTMSLDHEQQPLFFNRQPMRNIINSSKISNPINSFSTPNSFEPIDLHNSYSQRNSSGLVGQISPQISSFQPNIVGPSKIQQPAANQQQAIRLMNDINGGFPNSPNILQKGDQSGKGKKKVLPMSNSEKSENFNEEQQNMLDKGDKLAKQQNIQQLPQQPQQQQQQLLQQLQQQQLLLQQQQQQPQSLDKLQLKEKNSKLQQQTDEFTNNNGQNTTSQVIVVAGSNNGNSISNILSKDQTKLLVKEQRQALKGKNILKSKPKKEKAVRNSNNKNNNNNNNNNVSVLQSEISDMNNSIKNNMTIVNKININDNSNVLVDSAFGSISKNKKKSEILREDHSQEYDMNNNMGFGHQTDDETFKQLQNDSKALQLSRKILQKYEQQQIQNSPIHSDFDINNWTAEIDKEMDLYQMTLAGHLIQAIQFKKGEAHLKFLIATAKPFLFTCLRKKNGKIFKKGEEDRIIKGALSEYCFQKKDNNSEVWMLNEDKLEVVKRDTNKKLKKYIDSLKKNKGKAQQSIISQKSEGVANYSQEEIDKDDKKGISSVHPFSSGRKKNEKNRDKLQDKKTNLLNNMVGLEDDFQNMNNNNNNNNSNHNNDNEDIHLIDQKQQQQQQQQEIQMHLMNKLNANNSNNNTILNTQIEINEIINEDTHIDNMDFHAGSDIIQDNDSILHHQYNKIVKQEDQHQFNQSPQQFLIPSLNCKNASKEELQDRKSQSMKTALYRTSSSIHQNSQKSSNTEANLNQFSELPAKKKIVLSEKHRKINKLLEKQTQEYKQRNKNEFSFLKEFKADFEKNSLEIMRRQINKIDHIRLAGMSLCYGIFKDLIDQNIHQIMESQDEDVKQYNNLKKQMKQSLQFIA